MTATQTTKRNGKKVSMMSDNDPLAIPAFLLRSKDAKTKAKEAKEWDAYLSRVKSDGTPVTPKVNWLKPRSMTDEEFETYTAMQDAKKTAKLEKFKTRMATKIDTKGKRWDANNCRWIDEKTGAVALPAKEEMKAVRAAAKAVAKEAKAKAKAEKKERVAIPATGILAEFNCRPDTFRAKLLLTLEAAMGKMVADEALSRAVYGTPTKIGPLGMVVKGARATIETAKLSYELRDTDATAYGLFKLGAKEAKKVDAPVDRLRHHVSGAIASGKAKAIVEKKATKKTAAKKKTAKKNKCSK